MTSIRTVLNLLYLCLLLMIRQPPGCKRMITLCPYTTLARSERLRHPELHAGAAAVPGPDRPLSDPRQGARGAVEGRLVAVRAAVGDGSREDPVRGPDPLSRHRRRAHRRRPAARDRDRRSGGWGNRV